MAWWSRSLGRGTEGGGATAKRTQAQLGGPWSPPGEIGLVDPDGFLYADDDGPDDDAD